MNELVVRHGDQRAVLHPGQVAYVGRRDDSAVVVTDPRVSREHVRLSWGGQGWVLENVGRSGTFVSGQPVAEYQLGRPVEARLAVPDGPAVRFEPAPVSTDAPAAAVPPAAPAPAAPPAGVPPEQGGPHGHAAPRKAGDPLGGQLIGALRILVPMGTWLRDPAMRQWPRLLVTAYALTPLILLIVLQHNADLVTLGWVYCLYVAPLWALVFWFLIRPGPLTRLHLAIAAIIIAAEFVLIPALTLPWEHALAPPVTSHSLFGWVIGVGLPEELTKALPVMVLAIVLLKVRHIKLDVRMWMFLATLSGLFFGAYEASKVYVPNAIIAISHGSAVGIPEFAERVFVDGLQHALWAGIAGFFIGLGINYRRQRIPLWLLGIAVPTVLHGLNDWILTWPSTSAEWVWILIQAFSLFLFLGYTASAAAIEKRVRHTPVFRGDSMLMDASRIRDLAAPEGEPSPGAGPALHG
ncbi:MAG TPA: PrsW family glutamic-type intramembrane protease [Streptosporangiaceae bacterium]|jgi:RsiW-degrading membrane proteinase PrsW (M82 family)